MANYVEYIKVGSGESVPVRDADAQAKLTTLEENVTQLQEQVAGVGDGDFLPLSGGTLTGMLCLTEGVHYGDALPAAGNPGRIFWVKVSG
jgi:hypothetical protein